LKKDINERIKKLSEYYNVINNYKKILFSNYNNPSIAIKTNNKYYYIYKNNYNRCNFNKKLNLSNNINLTHLTFGEYFNQEIDLLNNINLTHLTFGYVFNQNICRNYTHNSFNKKIDLSKNISLTCLMKYIIY